MTTIKDIARLSGYSIGTVSRVINHHPDVSEAARQRIEEIIAQENFQPNSNAKMLKQQTDAPIAIIIRGYANIFFESLLEKTQNILRSAHEEASVVFVDESANEVQTAAQLHMSSHPKAFIFLGGNLEYFRSGLSAVDTPSVLLTNSAADLSFDQLSSYTTDDLEASACAVRYLIACGHRNIGIIGGSPESSGSQVGYRRLLGCRKAFNDKGVTFDEAAQYEPSRFSMEGGYQAATRLLKRSPQITAVFALGDSIAIGAMRAIEDMGLNCPQDVSVIGYDGIAQGRYTVPRLTSIRQDVDALARKGVEDLLVRLQYDRQAIHEIVPFELVEGESVFVKR